MFTAKEIWRSQALLTTCIFCFLFCILFYFLFFFIKKLGEDPNHRYHHSKRVDDG